MSQVILCHTLSVRAQKERNRSPWGGNPSISFSSPRTPHKCCPGLSYYRSSVPHSHSALFLLWGWVGLSVQTAVTLASVLSGPSPPPTHGSSGGRWRNQRSGPTSPPHPTWAHCHQCSVCPPTSCGCWHLGCRHPFKTCKSQRRCWWEPRPLGIQALSMNHI